MNNNNLANFVVFLDVDGVLNTRRTCMRAPSGLYIGIDEARIELLAKAMNETCADGVVLTTTWKSMAKDEEDYVYLIEGLGRYGIKVLGKTQEEYFTKREEGILKYLDEHSEIEEFVILDDQHFGFEDHCKLWESFLDTQAKGLEHSITASKTPSVAAILFQEALRKYANE